MKKYPVCKKRRAVDIGGRMESRREEESPEEGGSEGGILGVKENETKAEGERGGRR